MAKRKTTRNRTNGKRTKRGEGLGALFRVGVAVAKPLVKKALIAGARGAVKAGASYAGEQLVKRFRGRGIGYGGLVNGGVVPRVRRPPISAATARAAHINVFKNGFQDFMDKRKKKKTRGKGIATALSLAALGPQVMSTIGSLPPLKRRSTGNMGAMARYGVSRAKRWYY